MNAMNSLEMKDGYVKAQGHPGVRDYMLRYMAEVFVGHAVGAAIANVAAWLVSIVFGLLLLSAVNTAIVALVAIQFLMSRDHEIPQAFQKLNKFGVLTLGSVTAAL